MKRQPRDPWHDKLVNYRWAATPTRISTSPYSFVAVYRECLSWCCRWRRQAELFWCFRSSRYEMCKQTCTQNVWGKCINRSYNRSIQLLFVYNYLFSWNVALHAHVYLTNCCSHLSQTSMSLGRIPKTHTQHLEIDWRSWVCVTMSLLLSYNCAVPNQVWGPLYYHNTHW